MHTNRIAIAVLVLFVALVIALGAGITALVLIGRVENVTQDLVRIRQENNVANCIAANVGRDAVRRAVEDSLLALVPAGTTLTPEQEARIELYNVRVETGLPFRDCSPEGIEAFLKNQPPDPALSGP